MIKRFILVAGNIGSGKTSLTERLGERLGWRTAYESVVDNPYLPDFYADMRAWSFHLQIFFLGHRAQQHLEMAQDPRPAIIDRSIYEDAYIFARALHHMGNLNERDYQSYRQVFNLVTRNLPPPSLLIYPQSTQSRPWSSASAAEDGRSKVRFPRITWSCSSSFYDDWMRTFDLCPVLTIRSDDLDFVHQTQHLDLVMERIQEKLAGKEEIVF